MLLLCDHASNTVPEGVDLGVDARLLDLHIALDIGAGALTEALAGMLDAPAVIGTVSRLVIDLNRAPEQAGLVPLASDGHAIPGNVAADIPDRLTRFHAPYHAAIEAAIEAGQPVLIAAIHSFTPALEQGGPPRPWEIGILSNTDRRAAEPALALFADAGVIVGDNEPYSGRTLNATLDRHGEGRGIASLSIEVRNDLIDTSAGVAKWAAIIAPILTALRNGLAPEPPPAT
ncbi:N-formylglutamate amidohydrolase [Sphingomonas immobilis]|uniref:N-formylglutamate amidohydrolase n=1 Tax=Sphingomonas immobilis TaxID=3063997 RepID=A0ABT8ZUL2_9SPHN|nr:N-formylglutamate amidohydrolase [Sphingomonas sp. CA1-15]MDO7841273.1 N-formylglutamate amidohydrolase [Sphingomonas sp. CA1-15]